MKSKNCITKYHINIIYCILINEILRLRNIDEIKMYFFCILIVNMNFYCSETYFPYFHWSPAGLLSSNIKINKYKVTIKF